MQSDQPGADWTPGMPSSSKWMNPHERTYYKEPASDMPPYPTRPFDGEPIPGPSSRPYLYPGQVDRPNSYTGMSAAAEERNAKLQKILNKTLGADQIASRAGGGGSKLNYLEGWRAINLANDIFGFNGWFTDIKYLEADFVDYDPSSQRWHVGVTAIVRVRLQDGASHEDVGYGKIENCRSKGEALDKSKKEAVTDGLKRALRHFGKLLGNCLYDKHYLECMKNMKAPKPRMDWENIYNPERDTVTAMTTNGQPSTSTSAVPQPAAAGSKSEMPPPPPMPANVAAKIQRASTVGGPAPAPRPAVGTRPAAPAAAPAAAAGKAMPPPQPAKQPIQRSTTVPNPAIRSGASTPLMTSDDDAAFAEMLMPGDEVGSTSMANVSVQMAANDSGFGEMDGLADTSHAMIKPDLNPQAQKTAPNPHVAPQARSANPIQSAAAAAAAGSNTTSAASNNAELMEKKRLEAQARRAAKMQELAAKQQQPQQQPAAPTAQAPRPVAVVQQPTGGTGLVSAAQLLANSAANAPAIPPMGNARPPGLRPPQPPQQHSRPATLARTHSIGHNGGQADAPAGVQAGPRVAGALPSLNLGAGMARAAGASGSAAAPHGTTIAAGQAASGGPTSATTGDATFQSARSVKRGVEEVDHTSSSLPAGQHVGSAPQARRTSTSPRQALKELTVDETTGAVKRQRTSFG